ncbi:hypothetical protein PSCLAVI8L_200135 [Pseudoclavibacter sp. 8L]|nr:hypothetical protein PSCLAVI8L_200135 [Pseudoclavibacter sp. 8L]
MRRIWFGNTGPVRDVAHVTQS